MPRAVPSPAAPPAPGLFLWRRWRPAYWLAPERAGQGHLWPRWVFLRLLGLIYLSAFLSLLFQINGLIGPRGLLPARAYLAALAAHFGVLRFWLAPSLLWLASGHAALQALAWAGLAAAALLTLNRWPRAAIAAAEVLYLSFVVVARDFANYQSDGMLLAAGLIALFFAPPGPRPGLGADQPPTPASLFLLQWLWLRIYFESGLAKWLGGDPQWRHLTALEQYYQNNPLPTWVGYFCQQLPHGFQAAMALATLALELGLVWLGFTTRRLRLALFVVVTVFQLGLALTANYAFINWIMLALGVLLLDDGWLAPLAARLRRLGRPALGLGPAVSSGPAAAGVPAAPSSGFERNTAPRHGTARRWLEGVTLGWVLYATLALLLWMPWPRLPLPTAPVVALTPFRVANQYGLFARMTRRQYEIEFQGSRDGVHWTPYPFAFKPQRLRQAPGLYAPYQPRFDWNLWFAARGPWEQTPWVLRCEAALLRGDPAVLSLFAGNPFGPRPPRYVRAVLWRYWFTRLATLRQTGRWWRRRYLGLYAPELRQAGGKAVIAAWPPG
ncbi:MAG: lipase maturation factor family protein [Terriglobales bacterium]